jgi:hypothetical protein
MAVNAEALPMSVWPKGGETTAEISTSDHGARESIACVRTDIDQAHPYKITHSYLANANVATMQTGTEQSSETPAVNERLPSVITTPYKCQRHPDRWRGRYARYV